MLSDTPPRSVRRFEDKEIRTGSQNCALETATHRLFSLSTHTARIAWEYIVTGIYRCQLEKSLSAKMALGDAALQTTKPWSYPSSRARPVRPALGRGVRYRGLTRHPIKRFRDRGGGGAPARCHDSNAGCGEVYIESYLPSVVCSGNATSHSVWSPASRRKNSHIRTAEINAAFVYARLGRHQFPVAE